MRFAFIVSRVTNWRMSSRDLGNDEDIGRRTPSLRDCELLEDFLPESYAVRTTEAAKPRLHSPQPVL